MAILSTIARFNGTWTTGATPSLPDGRDLSAPGSRSRYNYNYYVFCGRNSSAAQVKTTYKFNTSAVSVDADSQNVASSLHTAQMGSFNYLMGGNSGGSASELLSKYNGTAWSTAGTAAFTITYGLAQTLPSGMVLCSGSSGPTGTNACDYSRLYTPSETASTISPSGNIAHAMGSALLNSIVYKISGYSGTSSSVLTTAVRSYNGSAWSAGIVIPTAKGDSNSSFTNSTALIWGGYNGSGVTTESFVFNGTSWANTVSFVSALSSGQGA